MQMLQGKISALEAAIKRPELTDADRKQAQDELDKSKKELEALKSAAPAPAPAATPAP